MDVKNALYPTGERLGALINDTSLAPIVMLNLLKFRAKAEYADGRATKLTGFEAYNLYGDAMQKIVAREGGKVLFVGQINSLVIGMVEDMWDAAALVEYPSAADFARITTLPQVTEIGVHRAAGLQGQLLIRVSPRAG
ncbi:MAG TPA: hypothetical protein VGT78_14715 [Rhizomicrobium sp.]|nr:hypothetical protein [Rhizomicrobium sp.]